MYDIISADSHINEPPDLFKSMPKHLQADAPQLVRLEKGDAWVLAPGAEPRMVATSAVAGRKKEEYLAKPITYENMCQGSFLAEPRLKDMDFDHIDADVMYPGIMRYQERFANAEVRLAACNVYNEWMADFCKFNPKRLQGVGTVPLLDDNNGKNAVVALEHARTAGLRTVFLSQQNSGTPLNHPDAERFWATAEDFGMPISVHIHTNPFTRGMKPEYAKLPGTKELGPTTVTMSMAEHLHLLVFGGVLMRHPKLKIVLAEGGIGWIPAVLERMDHVFNVHRHYMGSPIKELPSETYQKHFYATFGEDHVGVRLRDLMGVHTMMWASDYPHTDTTYPDSKPIIDKMFKDVSESDRRKIICENAAKLYGFV